MLKLSAYNVVETVKSCLYLPGESHDDAIKVAGVSGGFGFSPVRIEAHREDIKDLLSQLSHRFEEGASLLEAPLSEAGDLWGEQIHAEHLLLLGMAAGYVEQLIPYEDRQLWCILPGGLPYYKVTLPSGILN